MPHHANRTVQAGSASRLLHGLGLPKVSKAGTKRISYTGFPPSERNILNVEQGRQDPSSGLISDDGWEVGLQCYGQSYEALSHIAP